MNYLCNSATYIENVKIHSFEYRMRTIISCGLYNFYPIFHCGLYSKAANITDNLCNKQGNSSKKSAVYNQERLIFEKIYVVNKEILQKNLRFIIKSGFKSRAGSFNLLIGMLTTRVTYFLFSFMVKANRAKLSSKFKKINNRLRLIGNRPEPKFLKT